MRTVRMQESRAKTASHAKIACKNCRAIFETMVDKPDERSPKLWVCQTKTALKNNFLWASWNCLDLSRF